MMHKPFVLSLTPRARIGEVIEGWNPGNRFIVLARIGARHLVWQVAGWHP